MKTFDEFKTQKRILEIEILKLIGEFEHTYGISVSGVRLDHTQDIGFKYPRVFDVHVEVEI